jgi:glycosyltransferase involved in cell wall biosynthesis
MEATIRQGLRLRESAWHRFHYAALMDRTGEAVWVAHSLGGAPASLSQLPAVTGGMATARLVDLRASILARRRPHVAIISVLYRKADVVGLFLDMLCRQRYDGPMTIVFVDDCSPDDSVARAHGHRCERASAWPINLGMRIIRNQENLGNCASRNRGVAAVEADVYVVIDCDCLLNQDFVAAHADQHALPSTGVVCGPLNIESRGRDPVALVEHLELHPEEILQEAQLQDDIQPDAFVNCITRNFSIQRCHIPAKGLFDENFAYSARPGAGFGWEDVELGYRLYRAGVPIAFTERAFAVHVTHPSSVAEARQCVGSAQNFRLLFDTHPELALVVRRWSTETARRIEAWARQLGVEEDPAVQHIVERFALHQARLGPFLQVWQTRKRRLRILSYRWHAGHQYELHKLPHDFTLVTGLGERMTDVWSYEQRPLRPNVRFLPASAVSARDYDLAILHFDENSLTPDLGTGTLGQDWGRAFRHFLREFQLPKVAICHGTPQFVGQYAATREPIEQFEIHEAERRWLVNVLRDVPVVVNSWQALDEWGFQKGRVIWHGFDPQEFPPATRCRQVLSHGEDSWRPHYRGKHVLQRVRDILGEETLIETSDHPQAVLRPRLGNEFARANFRAYVDWIRSFTVYLNTTIRSPMPRARAEAMMCGVIPISLRNHDVEHFIRHGVNGFWGDSAEELAEYIVFLLRDPRATLQISEAARRTAMDVFNHDRYLMEWTALLTEVLA